MEFTLRRRTQVMEQLELAPLDLVKYVTLMFGQHLYLEMKEQHEKTLCKKLPSIRVVWT